MANLIATTYSVSDILFVRHSALLGKLEKVAIKAIRVNRGNWTPDCPVAQPVIQYIDTYNRIFFEPDLVTESIAITFASAFFQKRKTYLENLTSLGNFSSAFNTAFN